MKLVISWQPQSLFSFDFSREYGYVGFDFWRVCVFFRYRAKVVGK
jgi:hypothetical protein